MKKSLTFLLLLFLSYSLFAQRTIAGQKVIIPSFSYDLIGNRVGYNIKYGNYGYNGKFIYGLNIFNNFGEKGYSPAEKDHKGKIIKPAETYIVGSLDLTVGFGYYYPIYATRRHDFLINIGGEYDNGLRIYDIKEYMRGLKKVKFIFAFSPSIEFEVCPFRRMSISAFLTPRLQVYASSVFDKIFYLDSGIKATYYFF